MNTVRALIVIAIVLVLGACQQRAQPESDIVIAVRDNQPGTVAELITNGADPNATSRDGDPLIYVASGPKGGLEVVNVLIRRGADINAQAADGRTALANAAGWCDVSMVSLLINSGADVDIAAQGEPLEEMVCSGPLDTRAQVLALLNGAKDRE